MKGKLFKFRNFYTGLEFYRLSYIPDMERYSELENGITIKEEDMEQFMKNINKRWDKILTDKLNKALKPCKEE